MFNHGVVGLAASTYIPVGKVLMAIPSEIVINNQKIMESELKDLINNNPTLFDEKAYPSTEFNIFVIYLIKERLKGATSFYHPYL